MTEREAVIRECIEHLRGQPGRNAIRALKRLLAESCPSHDPDHGHDRHEEAVVKLWQLDGMADWSGMASRCQGAMLCADSLGRRSEGDDYAQLFLVARRAALDDTSSAQLAAQPGKQQIAQ